MSKCKYALPLKKLNKTYYLCTIMGEASKKGEKVFINDNYYGEYFCRDPKTSLCSDKKIKEETK